MREFIVEDAYGSAIRVAWNELQVSLIIEGLDDARTIHIDGKEALKFLSFLNSLELVD